MKVTLCGSMSFYQEMDAIGRKLEESGYEVKVPLLRVDLDDAAKDRKKSIRKAFEDLGGVDTVPLEHPLWQEKSDAIDDHFSKVAWCDAIVVVNYPKHGIEGYVGGNTLMEIALARYLRKKIYLLFPVSAEISYKEEILGMRPVILENNLSLII